MIEYKLARRSGACMECESSFAEGESIVSAIYPSGEEFVRRDVCERCFAGGTDAFSFWRARQPASPEEKKRLDYDLAFAFLDRLVREADPAREGLAYLLTLLLARKRRVRIRETRLLPEGELLTVLFPREEDDELLQVRAPRLGEAEIARLQAELEGLFGAADPAPEPPQDPPL